MFRRHAQQSAAGTEAARRAAAARHPAGSGLAGMPPPPPSYTGQSDCCPAPPQVKVVMPPTAGRPHPVDLLLCGHHYRASRVALDAAGVTVVRLGRLARL
jgi:hypothetical protein